MALHEASRCLAIALFLSPILCRAQSHFAHCDEALKQSVDAKSLSTNDEERRLAMMESLVEDFHVLIDEAKNPKSQIPKGYFTTCFNNKKTAWDYLTKLASDVTRGKLRYKLALAHLAEYQGDFEQAYERYSDVLQTDSSNYSVRWAAFANWHSMMAQKMQSRPLSTFTHVDIDRMTKELNALTEPLIDSPTAPKPYKIEALRKRARFMQYGLKSYVRAQQDWNKLLTFDATDKEALQAVAAYHDQRNDLAETRKSLEELGKVDPKNVTAVRRSLEIALQEEDYNGVRVNAKQALKRFPKDLQIKAMLAAALAKTGESEEALKITRAVLKAQPKLELARETQADILEAKGRKLAAKKLYGQALALYDQSLKLKPKNEKLRTDMALLLYDYRKDSNFQPAAPSRVDMNAALKILKPVLAQSAVDPNVLEAGISVAAKSSSPRTAAAWCDRHDREFGALPSIDLVIDCSTGYKAAGQKTKAESLLQGALKNPKYHRGSKRIGQALNGLVVQ
jgi:tetratricopeptide (TPR) repeat protein